MKKTRMWKRGLALALSAAMVSPFLPAAVEAADAPLLADFTFDDEAHVLTGGSAKATVHGSYELRDSKDAASGKALYLNGTTSNYLELTNADGGSLLAGKDEITISYDAKPDRTGTNWVFYAAPDNGQQTNGKEYYIGAFANGGNTKVERYNNGRTVSFTTPTGTDWSHVDIVYAEGVTSIYVNGEKKQSVENSNVALTDILGDEGIFYIGRANWTAPGEGYQGWIDNFKVYDGALTDDDLVDSERAAAAVAADKEALTLPEKVDDDFTLPSTGSNGCNITWTVAENAGAKIGEDGYSVTVTRSEEAEVTVQFTATITMAGISDTKTINVVVKKELSDAEVIAAARDKLDIVGKDAVKGNVTLPTTIEVEGTDKVATVEWKSSNTAVVTDKDQDGKAAGVVTRQETDTKVTMSATLSCGGVKTMVPEEIVLNVVAAPKNLDDNYTAGYLWTHFGTERGYEKIFFGYSEDGLTWEKLNKDASGTAQPILTNDAEGSDLGVRDPHVIRSAEGDKYWILGTDLHAEGGGAGGSGWNQSSASQNLVVWESDDLVTWSEPRLVYAGFDNAGCVWAPEAIYDESTGDYLVYWSSRDNSKEGTEENALRVYVCRTRDFVNFTEPKVWLSEDRDSGSEVNIIDSTIVEDNGKFYRFSTSDWNTVIDVSDTLSEDLLDVRVNENASVNGDWTRIVKRSGSSAAGFDRREGFTVYKLPDGRWCAMGDNGGYKAFVTDDLSSGKFTTEVTANFGKDRFRHGTVMRLSKAEQERLLEAYGEATDPDPDPDPEPTEKKVLAQFDFDDEETGFTSEDAKAEGNHTLQDSWNEENGKALYLNGSQFLNVTDQNGKSLLTGAKELTVSFEVKVENTSTNWPFYAAPNGNAQQYGVSEHYVGLLMKDGSLTVERYNQNGSRPANPSASVAANKWTRVDVVLTSGKTSVYINGTLESEVASSYGVDAILGNSSILQIGKANWGSGEYFKGLIDNMTIRNYALTGEEVEEEASDFVSTLPMVDGAVVGTAPTKDEAADYQGTDDHTAIITMVDTEKNVLTPYVRKAADVTKLPVTLELNGVSEITVDGKAFTNGSEMNLSKDVEVKVKNTAGREETWTIKAAVSSNNPVLPGQYADPDIDYFDGKFWIFPTTDGYSGWSGTVFHAFSSEDMVNWTDEGVILDLANDNPGTNDKGVQIAASTWAVGSAWAPSIEEKNGKYYFYYCGKFSNGQSAIGVAVADNPAGPYVDKGEALLTVSMCRNAGVSMGQAIDPSVFTDDDGTSYITFGNGSAAIAELNDDMMSIKDGSLKQLNGLRDFRESVVVIKANGKYHWTWSCDDTGSPNYHVNYGVSDTIDGNITYVKTLLSKDEANGLLGTAHQSMLHIKDAYGKDRYFIAYHRFYTPLGIYTSGLGYHRETCIDEVTFGEDGYMQAEPTLQGVPEVLVNITKDVLEEEIDSAPGEDQKEKYTEETWEAYQEALKKAEAVLADEEATQQEIDDAAEALKDAKNALEEKAEPVVLESITVTAPTKAEYTVGEELNLAGMKVVAKYSDDTEKEITEGYEVSGYDKAKTGEQTVTVTYEGKTATFKVTVKEAAVAPKLPYVDVVESDWFYDAAYYNYFAETMTGTDPTHFSPYEILPRAQFATILHRIEGKPAAEYTNRFPDVPDGQFYSTAVLWAADAKVVTGYTDSGYFGTNDPITREQMVVMMYRYADYKKYDISKTADLSSFSDAEQVSGFAETAMKWAVENGIIEGKENTDNSYRLDPQGSTSRAECAIIIQRFMETFDK